MFYTRSLSWQLLAAEQPLVGQPLPKSLQHSTITLHPPLSSIYAVVKTQLMADILAFGLCGIDFGICVLLASKKENNQLEELQSFRCLCSTGNKPFNRNPPLSNLRMD
jgi:hypothetical protein